MILVSLVEFGAFLTKAKVLLGKWVSCLWDSAALDILVAAGAATAWESGAFLAGPGDKVSGD